MQLPLQVSFRQMEHSAEIEALVREKAARLDKFARDIMSCRVVVEPAGKHHQYGNHYQVRIDLALPDKEIAVTRMPGAHAEYKDLRVTLRDAFDATRREVEDHVRQRRRDVKAHELSPSGRVSRLFPDEDHGIIETHDGREIYFHRHSVLHGAFDRLQKDTRVTFVEEEGEKGPQASTVRMVGHQHPETP